MEFVELGNIQPEDPSEFSIDHPENPAHRDRIKRIEESVTRFQEDVTRFDAVLKQKKKFRSRVPEEIRKHCPDQLFPLLEEWFLIKDMFSLPPQISENIDIHKNAKDWYKLRAAFHNFACQTLVDEWENYNLDFTFGNPETTGPAVEAIVERDYYSSEDEDDDLDDIMDIKEEAKVNWGETAFGALRKSENPWKRVSFGSKDSDVNSDSASGQSSKSAESDWEDWGSDDELPDWMINEGVTKEVLRASAEKDAKGIPSVKKVSKIRLYEPYQSLVENARSNVMNKAIKDFGAAGDIETSDLWVEVKTHFFPFSGDFHSKQPVLKEAPNPLDKPTLYVHIYLNYMTIGKGPTISFPTRIRHGWDSLSWYSGMFGPFESLSQALEKDPSSEMEKFCKKVDKDKMFDWLKKIMKEHKMQDWNFLRSTADLIRDKYDTLLPEVTRELLERTLEWEKDESLNQKKLLALEKATPEAWRKFLSLIPKEKEHESFHKMGNGFFFPSGSREEFAHPKSVTILKNGWTSPHHMGLFSLVKKFGTDPRILGEPSRWGVKLNEQDLENEEIEELQFGGYFMNETRKLRSKIGVFKQYSPEDCRYYDQGEAMQFEKLIGYLSQEYPHNGGFLDNLNEVLEGIKGNSITDGSDLEKLVVKLGDMVSKYGMTRAMAYTFLNAMVGMIMNRIPSNVSSNFFCYRLSSSSFLIFKGCRSTGFWYTVLEQISDGFPDSWVREIARMRCFYSEEDNRYIQHNWRYKNVVEFENTFMFMKSMVAMLTFTTQMCGQDLEVPDLDKESFACLSVICSLTQDKAVRNVKGFNAPLSSLENDFIDPNAMSSKVKMPTSQIDNWMFFRFKRSIERAILDMPESRVPPKPQIDPEDPFGPIVLNYTPMLFPTTFVWKGKRVPLRIKLMESKIFQCCSRFLMVKASTELEILESYAKKCIESSEIEKMTVEGQFSVYCYVPNVLNLSEPEIAKKMVDQMEVNVTKMKKFYSTALFEMFIGARHFHEKELAKRWREDFLQYGQEEKVGSNLTSHMRPSSAYSAERGSTFPQGALMLEIISQSGGEIFDFPDLVNSLLEEGATYIEAELHSKEGEGGKKAREFSVENVRDYAYNVGLGLLAQLAAKDRKHGNLITKKRDKTVLMQQMWNKVKKMANRMIRRSPDTHICLFQICADITEWSPGKCEIEHFFWKLGAISYFLHETPQFGALLIFTLVCSLIIVKRYIKVKVSLPDKKSVEKSSFWRNRGQIIAWQQALDLSPRGLDGWACQVNSGTMGKTHRDATDFQDIKERFFAQVSYKSVNGQYPSTLDGHSSADDLDNAGVGQEDLKVDQMANRMCLMRWSDKEETSLAKSPASFGVRGGFLSQESLGMVFVPEKLTITMGMCSQGSFNPSFGLMLASTYGAIITKIIKGLSKVLGYCVFSFGLLPYILFMHDMWPKDRGKTIASEAGLTSELPYSLYMPKGIPFVDFLSCHSLLALDMRRAHMGNRYCRYIGSLDPDFTFIETDAKLARGELTSIKSLSGLRISEPSRIRKGTEEVKESFRKNLNLEFESKIGDEIGLKYAKTARDWGFYVGASQMLSMKRFKVRKDAVDWIAAFQRSRFRDICKIGKKSVTIAEGIRIFKERAENQSPVEEVENYETCVKLLRILDPEEDIKNKVRLDTKPVLVKEKLEVTEVPGFSKRFLTPVKEVAYALVYGVYELALIAPIVWENLKSDLKTVLTIFPTAHNMDYNTLVGILDTPHTPDIVYLPKKHNTHGKNPYSLLREGILSNIVNELSVSHTYVEQEDPKLKPSYIRNVLSYCGSLCSALSPSGPIFQSRMNSLKVHGRTLDELGSKAVGYSFSEREAQKLLEIVRNNRILSTDLQWNTEKETSRTMKKHLNKNLRVLQRSWIKFERTLDAWHRLRVLPWASLKPHQQDFVRVCPHYTPPKLDDFESGNSRLLFNQSFPIIELKTHSQSLQWTVYQSILQFCGDYDFPLGKCDTGELGWVGEDMNVGLSKNQKGISLGLITFSNNIRVREKYYEIQEVTNGVAVCYSQDHPEERGFFDFGTEIWMDDVEFVSNTIVYHDKEGNSVSLKQIHEGRWMTGNPKTQMRIPEKTEVGVLENLCKISSATDLILGTIGDPDNLILSWENIASTLPVRFFGSIPGLSVYSATEHFMSEAEKIPQSIRPGLSGLARIYCGLIMNRVRTSPRPLDIHDLWEKVGFGLACLKTYVDHSPEDLSSLYLGDFIIEQALELQALSDSLGGVNSPVPDLSLLTPVTREVLRISDLFYTTTRRFEDLKKGYPSPGLCIVQCEYSYSLVEISGEEGVTGEYNIVSPEEGITWWSSKIWNKMQGIDADFWRDISGSSETKEEERWERILESKILDDPEVHPQVKEDLRSGMPFGGVLESQVDFPPIGDWYSYLVEEESQDGFNGSGNIT